MESPEMIAMQSQQASVQAPVKKKRASSGPRGPRRKTVKEQPEQEPAQAVAQGDKQDQAQDAGQAPRWSYVPDISPEDDWRPGQGGGASKATKPSEPVATPEAKSQEVEGLAQRRNADNVEESKPKFQPVRPDQGFNKNHGSGQNHKFSGSSKYTNNRPQGHGRPGHVHRNNPAAPHKSNGHFNGGHSKPTHAFQGVGLEIGELPRWERAKTVELLTQLIAEAPQPSGTTLDFTQHYSMPLSELTQALESLNIDTLGLSTRQVLLRKLMQSSWANGVKIQAQGVLDIQEAGYGFLVYARDSYSLKPLSAFVPACLIEAYGLGRADTLCVRLAPPRGGESCPVVVELEAINGQAPTLDMERLAFENLELQGVHTRFNLWANQAGQAEKFLDTLAPLAKGQRGTIIAPGSSDGASNMLASIAKALVANHPQAMCQMLIVDGRPEHSATLRKHLPLEVVSTSFDQSGAAHIQLANTVFERAKRLVEAGQDVILLVDSLTRLARAFRACTPCNAPTPFTGVEAKAMQELKKLWACAGATHRGGSLTILGIIEKDAHNRLDEAILHELRGTSNWTVELEGELPNAEFTWAVNLAKLWNAYEKDFLEPKELEKIYALKRTWLQQPQEALEGVLERLAKANSREAFFKAIKA